MIRAIIFDLDDTLVKTERLKRKMTNPIFLSQGLIFEGHKQVIK